MFGKLLGAMAGKRLAKNTQGMSGPAGAVLGASTAVAARRLGPLGLIAAIAGGFAFKRYLDRRDEKPSPPKKRSRAKAKTAASEPK